MNKRCLVNASLVPSFGVGSMYKMFLVGAVFSFSGYALGEENCRGTISSIYKWHNTKNCR